ncbi:RNA directed DNA polymerase reverse transcriptase [Echinococcus multilocularis]|uniref:RNA directed DNA polymerase reverse transcriptase n=1 Tax=Echinococcus multilocularis TaxID=6211 RepID=A0A068XW24_ECHMU|nr:RNA directed DNA polymerase reverse transcriptase [Echinococcus multilocularis]
MVDYFTKAAEAEHMKSQDAETAASVFFNRWICRHGVADSVHSNQGPNFESQLFIELCKMCRISKTRTTPAHPQGNGQDLSLGRVLLAPRVTVHTSTGVSPFKMPTGRKMRVPSDIFVPNIDGSADNVMEHMLSLQEVEEELLTSHASIYGCLISGRRIIMTDIAGRRSTEKAT